jgi:hypothetical protein
VTARRLSTVAGALALAAAAAAIGCSRNDSLVLLDLRASGPLGAPVARIRLSAKGWATRVINGGIGADGFRVGYYGPGNGGAVSVTAEALDDAGCVLGAGSATVPKLASGATSDPLTLFVRPQPANGCVPDAGAMDAGGDDSGGDDAGVDAEVDSAADAGDDSAGDGSGDASDGGTDAGVDSAGDASGDAGEEAGADGGDDVGVDSAADAMSGTPDGDVDATADGA